MPSDVSPQGSRLAAPLPEGLTAAPGSVQLLSLVPDLALPTAAPAATRARVPAGYGVQEQCLPFTAATSLGFLVVAPFGFGICAPEDVPPGAVAFTSPLEAARVSATDDRLYYVIDDPGCRFAGNAFRLDESRPPPGSRTPHRRLLPGLSFFDRRDQGDLFKVHLPYIWRTPPQVDALFLPPLNRRAPDVLAGLVETDWYASPVNLVLRRPAPGEALHVARGDPLAQVVLVARDQRRPGLTVLAPHARAARTLRAELADWYRRHAGDRSAYKRMVRRQRRTGARD